MPNDDPEALRRRVHVTYPVRGRPRDRPRDDADRQVATCVLDAGALQRHREDTGLVPLGVVPGPARRRRLRAPARPRPLPGRRRPDVRDVRPRADRLLAPSDRTALVRGRAGRPRGRRDAAASPHDGRVRRGVLAVRLGAAVRFPGGKPAGRDALSALRHVCHGRPPARGNRSRLRRAGLGVRRDARRRARVSGRALRRRSGRRLRPDGGGAPRRPAALARARSASRVSCRRWRRAHDEHRGGAEDRPPGRPITTSTSASRSRRASWRSSRSSPR